MVIEFIDSENPSLTLLMSKCTIRDKWLTEFEKVKQPGTVKSYLGTLNQFYLFIQVECADKFEALNVSQPDLISLANQVKLWVRSYRKLSQDRFWEKRVEDLANKKTPEDIRKFDSFGVARTAVKTIGEFNEQDQLLTQVEYTNVRDYLLTVICINNGSRSGSLANMTLEEFKQATMEEGCYVVRVKKHKTFTTHGPVNVVLHPTLHKYVEIFISKMRNCLPDTNLDTKETVFLNWKGCEMYSSHVGSQIGSCWGKEASTGGATSFRKAAVSAVHETNKEIRGDLANLMVHNRATADKYYLLEDKGKTAVRTSKELSRIMRDAHCTKTRNYTSGEPSTSSCVQVAVVTHRHKWKKDESAAVATLFATNIQNHSISLEEVRNVSKDHVILSKISTSKIRDKRRSLFTQNDPDDPEELPSLPKECETPEERLERFGIPPAAGLRGNGHHNVTNVDDTNGDNTNGKDKNGDDDKEDDNDGDDNDDHDNDDHDKDDHGKDDDYNGDDANDDDDNSDDSSSCNKNGNSNGGPVQRHKIPSVVPGSTTSNASGKSKLFTSEENAEFQNLFKDLINSKKQILSSLIVSRLNGNSKLAHLVEKCSKQQLADKVRTERKIAASHRGKTR
ncbi:Neurofilament medium polypeptide [Paramuricea clavata]|uniref:Neurofilament medium polypeptide n=1 Tax=Paramuricea clavata TaxID=317549 RepID=A0A6S7KX39_PARCT|nr:Neurofilament medium polypeptide [Paramuricea clavata]